MFFYRIGTDGSVKQSALRAFRKMFTFHTERIMAVFSNRPFRFGKGFAAFAPLRFNPTEEHEGLFRHDSRQPHGQRRIKGDDQKIDQ